MCVVHVAWNKPPYKPIPLFKNDRFNSRYAKKLAKSKIRMATLDNKILLSRLVVTAFDNNNEINEVINIEKLQGTNLYYRD